MIDTFQALLTDGIPADAASFSFGEACYLKPLPKPDVRSPLRQEPDRIPCSMNGKHRIRELSSLQQMFSWQLHVHFSEWLGRGQSGGTDCAAVSFETMVVRLDDALASWLAKLGVPSANNLIHLWSKHDGWIGSAHMPLKDCTIMSDENCASQGFDDRAWKHIWDKGKHAWPKSSI